MSEPAEQFDDADELAELATEFAAQGSPITYGPPPDEASARESAPDQGPQLDYINFLHDQLMLQRHRLDELYRRLGVTEEQATADASGLCPAEPPAEVIGEASEGDESPADDTFSANSANDGWVDLYVMTRAVYDESSARALYGFMRRVRLRACSISAEVRFEIDQSGECTPP